MTHDDFRTALSSTLDQLEELLVEKNLAYGNSALDPVRVFSSASPLEQINVRIDDKLSRIAQGRADDEDAELDLIGYLLLRRIARTFHEARDGELLDAAIKDVPPITGRPLYEVSIHTGFVGGRPEVS